MDASMPISDPGSSPMAPPSAEPAINATSVSAGWTSTEEAMMRGLMMV